MSAEQQPLDIEKERLACAAEFGEAWARQSADKQMLILGGWLAAKRSTTPAVTGEAGGGGLTKPYAWAHTMDNTEGIKSNKPHVVLTFGKRHPFGVAGRDYSKSFPVTSEPLFTAGQVRAAVKAAGQGGEDARDAARYRFRKQFLASGGAIHFGSFGCQLRRPGELVSTGATEEEAIDAALTNKADGGEA